MYFFFYLFLSSFLSFPFLHTPRFARASSFSLSSCPPLSSLKATVFTRRVYRYISLSNVARQTMRLFRCQRRGKNRLSAVGGLIMTSASMVSDAWWNEDCWHSEIRRAVSAPSFSLFFSILFESGTRVYSKKRGEWKQTGQGCKRTVRER